MFVSKNIPTDHKDLIHDVAYDFYGKRMATCSSDQSVKVVYFTTKSVGASWSVQADKEIMCVMMMA